MSDTSNNPNAEEADDARGGGPAVVTIERRWAIGIASLAAALILGLGTALAFTAGGDDEFRGFGPGGPGGAGGPGGIEQGQAFGPGGGGMPPAGVMPEQLPPGGDEGDEADETTTD